jgi:membrane protein
MAESDARAGGSPQGTIEGLRAQVARLRALAMETLVGRVWVRMLEIEFVDRGVALAGKAFVSFFPLVIVVAAFMPEDIRNAILTTITHRLGLTGDALATAREAFASSDDVRRATGILGLVLTFFFANSFTTALQRVYLRAWRRPYSGNVGAYTRGPVWLLSMLAFLAVTGGLSELLGGGVGKGAFLVLSIVTSSCMWWFTAWFLLKGEVRWRALVPCGLITGIAMLGYAASARVWMPGVVTRNQEQFGFFGVALALVTWFSGAAICVIVGACAGPVIAEDRGRLGALVRGRERSVLVEGAPEALGAPTRELRLRDAFSSTDDELLVDAAGETPPPPAD